MDRYNQTSGEMNPWVPKYKYTSIYMHQALDKAYTNKKKAWDKACINCNEQEPCLQAVCCHVINKKKYSRFSIYLSNYVQIHPSIKDSLHIYSVNGV